MKLKLDKVGKELDYSLPDYVESFLQNKNTYGVTSAEVNPNIPRAEVMSASNSPRKSHTLVTVIPANIPFRSFKNKKEAISSLLPRFFGF